MGSLVKDYSELRDLAAADWPAYLDARSGLPGPRANLPLAAAAATYADEAAIEALLADGGEYPTMCAAAAWGLRSDATEAEARARRLASDARWRVREGVAIGLQMLGDREFGHVARIVGAWVDDPDPLVQRAAVATVCEPRLLRTPAAAAVAVEACRRATEHLEAMPPLRRRDPDVRTLRQALGYCWSVAVAADPAAGLPAFRALDGADPDIAWIIGQNLRKKRLTRILETSPGQAHPAILTASREPGPS